jgi:hypothetical protein
MANTSSINSELFANLVTAAQFAAYENSVARQMVTVFDAPVNAGKVLQVPVWSGISAELITDESAATAKDTNTTSASITLGEHVVYHQVTDMLRDSSYSDVFTQIGDQSGRAIAESMDKQVFSLFTSFSTEVGPGAGGEVTVDTLLKAAATLRSGKLTGPFFAVLHPRQAYNVKKQLANAGASTIPSLSAVGDSVLSGFYLGTVAGIQIYESGLITVDGSDDAIGAVFARTAIGHAMRGSVEMNELYLPKERATDVVLKAVAGAAILQNSHGVKITGDAAL